jgi:hypothetical protein
MAHRASFCLTNWRLSHQLLVPGDVFCAGAETGFEFCRDISLANQNDVSRTNDKNCFKSEKLKFLVFSAQCGEGGAMAKPQKYLTNFDLKK